MGAVDVRHGVLAGAFGRISCQIDLGEGTRKNADAGGGRLERLGRVWPGGRNYPACSIQTSMAKVADRADVLKGRYCRQQIARPELKHKRG